MLFKQELAEKILAGDKTQTRRPVKAGEVMWLRECAKVVFTAGGRVKIRVGGDYAVQYKYGLPMRWWHSKDKVLIPYDLYLKKRGHGDTDADFLSKGWKPMRIRVTDIRREDVRNISHADALAEGFSDSKGFLATWCGFYDKTALPIVTDFAYSPAQVAIMLGDRPAKKYEGWAYTIELVV